VRQPPTPPSPPRTRRAALLGAALLAGAAAFVAGRLTSDETPPREAQPASGGAPAAEARGPWRAASRAPWGAAGPDAAPAPAPAAAAAPSRAEVVALATSSARAQLEGFRASLLSRCDASPAPGEAPRVGKLTFNLTFDANGREIARGISEDRRARLSPPVARCLRELPRIGSLAIPAPGVTVGVKVAMTFP
jgi:hypothetical protein